MVEKASCENTSIRTKQVAILVLLCLALFGGNELQVPLATPAQATCTTCPVASVDSHASKRFVAGRLNVGGPCTVQMKNGFPFPDPKCTHHSAKGVYGFVADCMA